MNLLWTDLASRAGISLTESQNVMLDRYLDLLLEANTRMNLTRITDRAAAEIQHVGDSLTLLPFLPKQSHKLVDVGSGGGVPGIPLAILRPDVAISLIESTKKKAAILRQIIDQLQLTHVTVIDSRAEQVGRGPLRESFDVAVVRAVATLDWLAEWCLPLVKRGGHVFALKGEKAADELKVARTAIKLMGAAPALIHPIDLLGTAHHVIIEMTKKQRTHHSFPRDPTQAKGKPIA